MNFQFSGLVIFLLHTCHCLDYDGWLNINLEHSFGIDDAFSGRGNISIQSVRMNSFALDQRPLKEDQLKKLETAASKGDLYSIRALVQSNDGTELDYLTSMKASALLECELHDAISILISPSGSVVAVTATPMNAQKQAETRRDTFKTQLFIRQIEQAPVPDTASYIQKIEREREAREKGDFKDNRSFLAKYWMYIVPVVLFVMISGAANPEQGTAR